MFGRASGKCQSRASHFTTLWLCVRGGLGEGTVPLPGFWRFAQHSYLFPVTSLTPHMPLVPLPALALVLNPRGGRSVYVLSLCGPFKQSLLKIWQFLLPPKPNWFLQPEVMGIYLPGTGTLGYADWSGAGFAGSQGILPNFYPPHVNVGPPVPLPLPLHATPHHTTSPCLSAHLHPSYPCG